LGVRCKESAACARDGRDGPERLVELSPPALPFPGIDPYDRMTCPQEERPMMDALLFFLILMALAVAINWLFPKIEGGGG